MINKNTVIFLGANGFPFGSAVVQRQLQLGKALVKAGYKVIVINKRGIHSKDIVKREKIFFNGSFQGVEYYYTSFYPIKPNNFLSRNLLKMFGFVNEIIFILLFKIFSKNLIIFNNSIKLNSLKYYYYLSRIFRIKFVYDYVEYISSLGKRNTKYINIQENKFDHKFHNYTDSIICISSYLEKSIKKNASYKKIIKIPPITDFSYIDNIKRKNTDCSYFLFCGSAAYEDIIKFIISAFLVSEGIQEGYSLKLVINGTEKQLKELKDHISKTNKSKYIEVLSQINYEHLISLYKSSFALLIPLFDSLQDKARFPFKISEYTAAMRPIITSDSGPIEEFFIDKKNALIAKKNDLKDFSEKMNYLIRNRELSSKIGYNGYLLGKEVFNYNTYIQKLKDFLEN